MKVYKVKVNGKVYEVELESINESNQKIEVPQIAAGGEEVKAPMAGTINQVKVQNGDKVEKGQVLLILEAMKLENEIKSPVTGTIKEIRVSQGQAVTNNQIMIIIG